MMLDDSVGLAPGLPRDRALIASRMALDRPPTFLRPPPRRRLGQPMHTLSQTNDEVETPAPNRHEFLQARASAKRRVKKVAAATKGQGTQKTSGNDVPLGSDDRVHGCCGGSPRRQATLHLYCTLDV